MPIENQPHLSSIVFPESSFVCKGINHCADLYSIDFGGTNHLYPLGDDLPSLREMSFSAPDIHLEDNAFCNLYIEEFEAPDGINTLPSSSFCDCPNLRYLNLQNVKSIGSNSICGNPKLETLILPKELSGENSLDFGLSFLTALKKIVLPKTVPTGFYLYECLYVSTGQDIYCPSSNPIVYMAGKPSMVSPMDECVFGGLGLIDPSVARVYVPIGCKEVYKNHICWEDFENIVEYNFNESAIYPINPDEGNPFETIEDRNGISSSVSLTDAVAVYDMVGREIKNGLLKPGIYVIRDAQGILSKVCVK